MTQSRKKVAILSVFAVVILLAAGVVFALVTSQQSASEGGASQKDNQTGSSGAAQVSANPSRPASRLEVMTVANATERGAICNDGSPAKYFFRPGTEENKDKWVIWFKGGGGCGDEATCLVRAQTEEPGLMSSKSYGNSVKEDGILSADADANADFYNWNLVKLMYCSSDNWAGATEQTIGGETWYFHGKAITEAIFEDLQNPDIIETANLGSATQVLIAGSSAGGGGVGNNLDDIAQDLSHADVKGFIDSSWSYDNEVYAVREGTETRSRSGQNDFQNKVLDDTCAAAHSADPSLCTLLSELYPFLETPTFIFQNQYDNLKMKNLGLTTPFDAEEQAWLDSVFLPGLFESFEVVEDGLFSPKKSFHTMLTESEYRSTEIGGTSIQEAFTSWYFDRPGETRLIEE